MPDRPIGLVLIVIRCGIMAISYGYETFQVLALYTQDRLTSPALGLCFAALCFMLALVSVVIPWELWFLKDWARRWMVGLMGVDLLLGMLGVLLGSPGPSSGQITGQLCGALIVNGLIVWYLLRPGIAERFSFW